MIVADSSVWIDHLRGTATPQVSKLRALIGAEAVVLEECRPFGRVRVNGELWRARCDDGADAGETVVVRALDGLTLVVDRA